MRLGRLGATALGAWVAGLPERAWSCAVCVGNPNDPQTIGMSKAILGMLGITGGVLACLAAFFIVLWRRSRRPVDNPDQVLAHLERKFQSKGELAV